MSSTVSVLITFKLYDRYLGREMYGVLAVAQQVLANLLVLDGGFRTVTNRALLTESSPERRLQILQFTQTTSWLVGIAGALVGVILMCGYAFTRNAAATGVGLSFFVGLGLLAGGTLTSVAQMQMLTGIGLQHRLFAFNSASSLIFLSVLWAGLRAHLGPWAFSAGILTVILFNSASALFLASSALPEFRPFRIRVDGEFRNLWRTFQGQAWITIKLQVAVFFLYGADVIIAGLVCFSGASGTYGALARIFFIIRQSLQSADESLWPSIANRAGSAAKVSDALRRLNGWLYGAVAGAATVTLPVFFIRYLRPEWKPEPGLVALFALRGVIAGISSQPSYYLYGHGRFDLLLRHQGREVLVAIPLAAVLGIYFGPRGVMGGFVLATAVGTLWPLIRSYTTAAGIPAGRMLRETWGRAIVGGVLSLGFALAILRLGSSWQLAIAAGAGAGMFAVVWAIAFAWVRSNNGARRPILERLAEGI